MDKEFLLNKVKKYKCVSFDVFDTLIKRSVPEPEYVFKIVEMLARERCQMNVDDFSFYRIKAENNLKINSFKEEFTLNDIYKEIKEYKENEKEILMSLEIEVEENICIVNYDLLPVYQYCLEKCIKIYIISDMYLSFEVVQKILCKNGIDQYEKLFVSSRIGLKKRSGNLYKYILKNEKILKRDWIHIGDGRISDFIRPRLIGINSVLIARKINKTHYCNYKNLSKNEIFRYQLVSSFINNNLGKLKGKFIKFGYEIYGPLLYGFSVWLGENLKKEKINHILFMSRDGYIVQKAFHIVNTHKNIKDEYFYASRRSLYVPAINCFSNFNDFWKMFSYTFPKKFSLEFFMKRYGIEIEKYLEVIKKHNYNKESILERDLLSYDEKFLGLYKEIYPDVLDNVQTEYKGLLKYLDNMKMQGNIVIVDVGWRGTLQNLLNQIIKKEKLNIKLKGYYVGVRHDVSSFNTDMFGFISSNLKDALETSCIVFSFVALIELLFTAPHGSVNRYILDENGDLQIKLDKYEFNREIILSEELRIKEIQEGAMRFVQDINNNRFFKNIEFTPNISFNNLLLFGIKPKYEDAVLIGDFMCDDTLVMPMACPKSILTYILKPRQIFIDFLNSRWRIAFLKRLFRFNFPYYWMMKLLYRWRN